MTLTSRFWMQQTTFSPWSPICDINWMLPWQLFLIPLTLLGILWTGSFLILPHYELSSCTACMSSRAVFGWLHSRHISTFRSKFYTPTPGKGQVCCQCFWHRQQIIPSHFTKFYSSFNLCMFAHKDFPTLRSFVRVTNWTIL